MSLRLTGGQWRGRPLAMPKDRSIRPTSARTREAMFNLIEHHRDVRESTFPGLANANVLDLFCGVGTLGLEALSRGAASALAIANDRTSLRYAKENADQFGAPLTTRQADATKLPPAAKPFELVLMDPPYEQDLIPPTLESLCAGGWLAEDAIIIAETQAKEALEIKSPIKLLETRHYGNAALWLLIHQAQPEHAETKINR